MKITRLAGLAAFAVASLLLAGSSSQAAFVPLSTTLDQLLPPTNFTTVGPLTFSNFSYNASGNVLVPASSINVSALDNNGIQFAGPFVAASPNAGDSLIGMTVTAAPGLSLTSITLSANPATTGTGAIASITETIFATQGGPALGQIIVFPGTPGLSQTFTLATALTSVFVQKDIAFAGGPTGGTANISFVRQTFTVVPEPASVVMMGLGLVGAIGVVRLRRKPVVA